MVKEEVEGREDRAGEYGWYVRYLVCVRVCVCVCMCACVCVRVCGRGMTCIGRSQNAFEFGSSQIQSRGTLPPSHIPIPLAAP